MDPISSNDPVGSPPPYTPPPYTPPPVGDVISKDERLWGMLTHLTALSGLVGVPLGNILGPLIMWLIKKNEMPFVDDQGKESLNFQITMTIIAVICIPFCFILIGIPALIAVYLADFVLTIIASIKANDGVVYRYPFTWRLIK